MEWPGNPGPWTANHRLHSHTVTVFLAPEFPGGVRRTDREIRDSKKENSEKTCRASQWPALQTLDAKITGSALPFLSWHEKLILSITL